MPRHPSTSVARLWAGMVLAVASVLVAAACAGTPTSAPSTASTASARAAAASPTTVRTPRGTVVANDRTRLAGFKEVTVTVVDRDGVARTFCLMLADTDDLREQGLMFVTDPALGGYDGMLFTFDVDTDGAFWMKNTRLPLSIAYLGADGTTTATTDMRPCPDDAPTCPVYPPGGTYRDAIEVAQGRLDALGVSDRSKVTIGATSCAPLTRGT